MKAKKIAGHSISGIVVLVLTIAISFLTENEAIIGKLIETVLSETAAVATQDSQDGEIRTLVVAKDGDTILNSDKLQLAGGLDFTGIKGDAIILQKMDGVWVQIGKRLVDMENFQ